MKAQNEKLYNNSFLINAAQVVSDTFSPLLIPTYGMAMAMWLTSLRTLPERNRLIVTVYIAVLTGLFPLIYIMVMRRLNRVSDMSISRRSERPWPMFVAMLCYILAGFLLDKMHAPLWLQFFFYGAALATAVASIISIFWKISAHATSIGGLVGLLLWFAVDGIADVNAMVLLTVGIIIAGIVSTSRLILHRHTLMQVLIGLILGLSCTFGLDFLILR